MKTVNKAITVYLIEEYKLTRIGLKSVLRELSGILCIGDSDSVHTSLDDILRLKPDVILIDISLSDKENLFAIRKIKELAPEIKIVIMAERNNGFEAIMALSIGALGYCMKDSSDEILEKTIKTVYSGACYIDASIWGFVLKYLPTIDDSMNFDKLYQIDKKYMLSKRELEVLKYVVKGKSNIEIAENMFVSVNTAKVYIGNIFKKLSVNDRVQAAVKAIREQLI